MQTEIKSYLCKSVLVQKGLPKPLVSHHRGRSQGGAVICRRGEARQLYSGGCRVGLHVARVSALCTKREFLASEELPERSIRLSSLVLAGKWRGHPEKTDCESDRRSPTLSLRLRVMPIYKASSERIGIRNGEEKTSLVSSSLRMTADPDYLPSRKRKEKPQRVGKEASLS